MARNAFFGRIMGQRRQSLHDFLLFLAKFFPHVQATDPATWTFILIHHFRPNSIL
jgi:hypothetical protein